MKVAMSRLSSLIVSSRIILVIFCLDIVILSITEFKENIVLQGRMVTVEEVTESPPSPITYSGKIHSSSALTSHSPITITSDYQKQI